MARQSSRQQEFKDANNRSKIHVFTEAGGNGFWLLFGQNSFVGEWGEENITFSKYCFIFVNKLSHPATVNKIKTLKAGLFSCAAQYN